MDSTVLTVDYMRREEQETNVVIANKLSGKMQLSGLFFLACATNCLVQH